jgi:16S rRNA G966 N2-methylase RsmD
MSTKLSRSYTHFTLYKSFKNNLSERGFVKTIEFTLLWTCQYAYDSINDWRFGIKTDGFVEASILGYENPAYGHYLATPYHTLFTIFSYIKNTIPDAIFIDYGSGMGRAIIVAATYPFQKVIGIDLSHELNNIAKDNVKKAISKLFCKNIEIIEADAKTCLPHKQATHFFLFNPFDNEILQCVLDNIYDSLIDNPRDIILIYLTATTNKEGTALDECKWLLKTDERNFPVGTTRRVVRFYSNKGGKRPDKTTNDTTKCTY